jgi:hypothetical protein
MSTAVKCLEVWEGGRGRVPGGFHGNGGGQPGQVEEDWTIIAQPEGDNGDGMEKGGGTGVAPLKDSINMVASVMKEGISVARVGKEIVRKGSKEAG